MAGILVLSKAALQEYSMIRSMTGFGRATGSLEGETFSIELSTVNHRFLESSFRLPPPWSALEPVLREVAKKHLSRGKLNVSVRRERGAYGKPHIVFDADVAQQYITASKGIAELMSSMDKMSLDTLVRLDGVFYQEESAEDLEAVEAAVGAALEEALTQLDKVRAAEGLALAEDVRNRIEAMREALAFIETRIPELAVAYEERLRERVKELNVDTGLSEERLAVEITLMADKADVNEEAVRLRAHFEHVESLLSSPEPIGRELNFLTQEIQREINTLGSKLRDLGVTREVMRVKSELEKLREQAQNIE